MYTATTATTTSPTPACRRATWGQLYRLPLPLFLRRFSRPRIPAAFPLLLLPLSPQPPPPPLLRAPSSETPPAPPTPPPGLPLSPAGEKPRRRRRLPDTERPPPVPTLPQNEPPPLTCRALARSYTRPASTYLAGGGPSEADFSKKAGSGAFSIPKNEIFFPAGGGGRARASVYLPTLAHVFFHEEPS